VASTADVSGPPVRPRHRANRILHEPRLLALLLAGGVMATIVVFVIGFSGAFDTSTSSDKGGSLQAGKIKLGLSATGELINGASLTPGVTRSGTVTVTNVEQTARVTLRVSNLVDTPASPSLTDLINVTVRQIAPVAVNRFTGKLRTLTTDSVSLGTWAPGDQRSFQINVAWPALQDSATYANAKTTFVFEWRAESVAQ
jgi:hypothetical protein